MDIVPISFVLMAVAGRNSLHVRHALDFLMYTLVLLICRALQETIKFFELVLPAHKDIVREGATRQTSSLA